MEQQSVRTLGKKPAADQNCNQLLDVRLGLKMIPDPEDKMVKLGECIDAEVIHIGLPGQINATVIVFPFTEHRDMSRQPISKTHLGVEAISRVRLRVVRRTARGGELLLMKKENSWTDSGIGLERSGSVPHHDEGRYHHESVGRTRFVLLNRADPWGIQRQPLGWTMGSGDEGFKFHSQPRY